VPKCTMFTNIVKKNDFSIVSLSRSSDNLDTHLLVVRQKCESEKTEPRGFLASAETFRALNRNFGD